MAKVEKLFNVSSGILILPDGTEVAPGVGFELTKEWASNSGVKSWVDDGLASSDAPRRSAPDVDFSALQAEIDKLTAELAEANGQIDKLTADLADANGQIDKLTADLADATKPAE